MRDQSGNIRRLGNRLRLMLARGPRRRLLPVADKFGHFRAIGLSNDAFLRHLANLQEGLDRSDSSRLETVASAMEILSAHISSMVKSFGLMTGGGAPELLRAYESLDREINQEVLKVHPIEFGPAIVWPSDADARHAQVVGPKAARLAEAAQHAGVRVPPFFSVSVYGYRLFLEGSGLQDVVNDLLWSLDLRDSRALKSFSDVMINAFAKVQVPAALEAELLSAYRKLLARNPGLTGVAVRSSAVVEDAESSFAGQFESVLNAQEKTLAEAYKRVVASKYCHEALEYSVARGFLDEDITMPVLVMAMVRPQASGVAYSRCPEKPESIMITAAPGLALTIVDGRVTPDTFLVCAKNPEQIEKVSLGKWSFSLRCADEGGIVEMNEDSAAARPAVLSPSAACEIARVAQTLEHHFGGPQDVEWVRGENGSLSVVQTRPLHMASTLESKPLPAQLEGYRILARGAGASGGVASGLIFHLFDPRAADVVPEGAILCVPTTSPRLATVLGIVRGVIAEAGSPTGHMATVAREFGVPCIVGADNAMSVLADGDLVTMDADAGIVYEGEVRELMLSQARSSAPARHRDPVKESMQRLLKRVAPLTLTEPEDANFDPGHCCTLHDIARYVHQKSMLEMFDLNELSGNERRAARRLIWRAPMQLLLLDLGGGLAPDADRSVPMDKVRSIPLRALIEGMTDPRLRWAGPVGFDFRGFVSVVVKSAADDQRLGEPTYCLCSQDYVHLASRLAYHFATVDSICGPSVNENYARFLFFGGAAVSIRREWRAHFLAKVLEQSGFMVKQVGDRVEAMFSKRDAEQTEEGLVMLGRLMVASRHLDMVIESKRAASTLAQAFLSGDYGFEHVGKTGMK